jgi:AraC family transcriptional regulator of adaptative response/methylated-DNA-[protein]-cysteine methyltransferase
MEEKSRLKLTLETFPAQGHVRECEGVRIDYGFHATPVGPCLIGMIGHKVVYLAFVSGGTEERFLQDLARRWPGALLRPDAESARRLVSAVFEAEGVNAVDLTLLLRGTEFQIEVWRALLCLPMGSVRSYADVARSIGRPTATRAVAAAIGANPVAWLVPCHRVVRSDGKLGGYRWGAAMKQACLAYEERRFVERG